MAGERSRRIERINELLREEISDLIRRELKDPRLVGMVSVTYVDSTPDLSVARVYISVMGSDEDKRASLDTLRRAAGFFHRKLMPRLRLRRVPDLEFRLDPSIERGDRVLTLLRQIEHEQASAEQADEGGAQDNPAEE